MEGGRAGQEGREELAAPLGAQCTGENAAGERAQQGSRVLTKHRVSTEQNPEMSIQRGGGPVNFAPDKC